MWCSCSDILSSFVLSIQRRFKFLSLNIQVYILCYKLWSYGIRGEGKGESCIKNWVKRLRSHLFGLKPLKQIVWNAQYIYPCLNLTDRHLFISTQILNDYVVVVKFRQSRHKSKNRILISYLSPVFNSNNSLGFLDKG